MSGLGTSDPVEQPVLFVRVKDNGKFQNLLFIILMSIHVHLV